MRNLIKNNVFVFSSKTFLGESLKTLNWERIPNKGRFRKRGKIGKIGKIGIFFAETTVFIRFRGFWAWKILVFLRKNKMFFDF